VGHLSDWGVADFIKQRAKAHFNLASFNDATSEQLKWLIDKLLEQQQRREVNIPMTEFLDPTYKVPESPSNYMDLEEGANKFRVLSSAITGWIYCTDGAEGKRTPHRVKSGDDVPAEIWKRADDKPKHFWAFSVYNYQTESIQILELTQVTIQRFIQSLVKNDAWGNPKDYDLVVTKTRTGSQARDVEYSVMPNPKTPTDKGILKAYEDVGIDLTELYRNGDPFNPSQDVDPDEVDRGLNAQETAA